MNNYKEFILHTMAVKDIECNEIECVFCPYYDSTNYNCMRTIIRNNLEKLKSMAEVWKEIK